MIDNVEKYARLQKPHDKTILGALSLLNWENVDKWHKTNKK